eukprot:TRINITY_DN10292_c0_g1_i2.p1 TRINITY_DN10292_c0_g1~~TRINITY_DN10292_c0_g1_i2.p1  ORF type:complete len:233 (+),score=2.80 TRINITY_DN10292_c0_g1_i2:427-1125(+)
MILFLPSEIPFKFPDSPVNILEYDASFNGVNSDIDIKMIAQGLSRLYWLGDISIRLNGANSHYSPNFELLWIGIEARSRFENKSVPLKKLSIVFEDYNIDNFDSAKQFTGTFLTQTTIQHLTEIYFGFVNFGNIITVPVSLTDVLGSFPNLKSLTLDFQGCKNLNSLQSLEPTLQKLKNLMMLTLIYTYTKITDKSIEKMFKSWPGYSKNGWKLKWEQVSDSGSIVKATRKE